MTKISKIHGKMMAAAIAADSLAYRDAFYAMRSMIQRNSLCREYAERFVAQPVYSPATMMRIELERLLNAPGNNRSRIDRVTECLKLEAA